MRKSNSCMMWLKNGGLFLLSISDSESKEVLQNIGLLACLMDNSL